MSKAADFVGALFLARDVAHSVHLNTRSYAKHKALNEFYDEIIDLADGLMVASSLYIRLALAWPKNSSVELFTASSTPSTIMRVNPKLVMRFCTSSKTLMLDAHALASVDT